MHGHLGAGGRARNAGHGGRCFEPFSRPPPDSTACGDSRKQVFFRPVNNRFLLIKCITMGALSFPTPFLIYFFIMGISPGDISYQGRFLLISILLLSGAIVGVASFYKDSAVAALKDWYPSERPGPVNTYRK